MAPPVNNKPIARKTNVTVDFVIPLCMTIYRPHVAALRAMRQYHRLIKKFIVDLPILYDCRIILIN
jgi:hypothetical protein